MCTVYRRSESCAICSITFSSCLLHPAGETNEAEASNLNKSIYFLFHFRYLFHRSFHLRRLQRDEMPPTCFLTAITISLGTDINF